MTGYCAGCRGKISAGENTARRGISTYHHECLKGRAPFVVSRSTHRVGTGLLSGLLGLQVLIVPWEWTAGALSDRWSRLLFQRLSGYAPIWAPIGEGATIRVGLMLTTLLLTGVALAAWLRFAWVEADRT